MPKPLEIGDKVVYAKSFLRSIGARPNDSDWRLKGEVVGLGGTASTWHCTACTKEVCWAAPSYGKDRAACLKITVSPCCSASVSEKVHPISIDSMRYMVRVQWEGDSFETTIHQANLCRPKSIRAFEDLPADHPGVN